MCGFCPHPCPSSCYPRSCTAATRHPFPCLAPPRPARPDLPAQIKAENNELRLEVSRLKQQLAAASTAPPSDKENSAATAEGGKPAARHARGVPASPLAARA